MSQNKPYYLQSFAIIVISIVALIGFKQFLPRKIFTETSVTTKNVVIDSMLLEAVQAENAPAEKDTLADATITFEAVNGIKFPCRIYILPKRGLRYRVLQKIRGR